MITIKNFAGIADEHAKLETAKIVLIPVPYDGTSTWQKGADKGPEAFLKLRKIWKLMTLKPIPKCINKVSILHPKLLRMNRQKRS